MEIARNMQKIIKKDCFLAKTLTGRETKKDQERLKRGGALIRAGAHIRDNTVLRIFYNAINRLYKSP